MTKKLLLTIIEFNLFFSLVDYTDYNINKL